MAELKLSAERINIMGEDEQPILSANLLDLYYLLVFAQEGTENASMIDKFKKTANVVNNEYGCNVSWQQVAEIFDYVETEAEKLKKN